MALQICASTTISHDSIQSQLRRRAGSEDAWYPPSSFAPVLGNNRSVPMAMGLRRTLWRRATLDMARRLQTQEELAEHRHLRPSARNHPRNRETPELR